MDKQKYQNYNLDILMEWRRILLGGHRVNSFFMKLAKFISSN